MLIDQTEEVGLKSVHGKRSRTENVAVVPARCGRRTRPLEQFEYCSFSCSTPNATVGQQDSTTPSQSAGRSRYFQGMLLEAKA